MNIRLNYLYRDYSNYKRHASTVFSNPRRMSPTEIEIQFLKGCAVLFAQADERQFSAAHLGLLPVFFIDDLEGEDDHPWHELLNLEDTNDAISDHEARSIDQLLSRLTMSADSAKVCTNLFQKA